MDLATDLAVLLGVSILGVIVARAIVPTSSRIELLGLAFPLGAGCLTFAAFLASWAGVPLNLTSLGILWLFLVGAGLGARRVAGFTTPATGDPAGLQDIADSTPEVRGWQDWPVRVSLLIFLLLAALAGVIAIGRSHSSYDAAAMWIVKGYGIAREGSNFAARDWGAHGLAYPLNIHLLVMLFRLTSGDRIPGSQLIFTVFYGSTVLTILGYWIRRGVTPVVCSLGLLFFGSIPVLILHSTIGFANLPMAFYVVSGAAYGLEGFTRGRAGPQLLGGILMGMASWTIIEGFQYAGIALVIIGLAAAWNYQPGLKAYARLTAPFVLLTGIWLLFYYLHGAQGSQAIGAFNEMLAGLRAGDYNLVEVRLIFGYMRRYLFDPNTWGVLFSAGGVIVLLGAWKLRREVVPEAFTTMSLFAGTAALTCALFYLRSFVTSDLLAWLIRGFPRGFLTSAIFFAMTVILVVPRAHEEGDEPDDLQLPTLTESLPRA